MQVLSFFDESYPLRLKHIATPSSFLFCQGNMNFSMSKVISIVGTRKATPYGKSFVEKFIAGLREYEEILVVSGLAYGIDLQAHKMCLRYGLSTVGVLAGGLDKIYPTAHKKVALDMLAHGGLVSETPIGSTLETFQFPQRNRIIAGLADATVVVEADYKSGAIITANFANAYNREVFAVPGNIDATYSVGCNHLIKTQQAHLLTSTDDLAYIMNWQKCSQPNKLIDLNKEKLVGLSQVEQEIVQVLKLLQKEAYIDEISQQIQLSPSQVSSMLLQLELKNIVECLPGNKFKLVKF
ncbi:MAG: DNA-processing protein DprA [Candidatus Amoebophilus sp.]